MARKGETANSELSDELLHDPRVRDPVIFNRIRDMLDKEVLHQAWGCQLWKLERLRKITREQREAGDEYVRVCRAYHNALNFDVDVFPENIRGRLLDTIRNAKKRFEQCRDVLWATWATKWSTGKAMASPEGVFVRREVDRLCLEEIYPESEKALKRICDGLSRLQVFFGIGTNRERKL